MITFGSVCSGIEAASVAWEPLGWRAAWFAEIEPFPCAVLAHHYPTVPNFGDMSKLPDLIAHGYVSAPDFLCGGTPCQAFSVAGLRKSLDDARGNLSLIFCEIANAIDAARDTPAIIFWENVPGVLNTSDNAFGCFLAGLAGEASALEPPGGALNGLTLVMCLVPREQSHGGCLTPNISEWPNAAAVCLLSQVLEQTSIPPRYYLSPKACAGILRRAEKRGKQLPEQLRAALEWVAQTDKSLSGSI
jgi:hypothetical protein